MDDMDAESEEFGGKRSFFAGDFARYGWAKLMHAGLGDMKTLNLYAEGITKMPEPGNSAGSSGISLRMPIYHTAIRRLCGLFSRLLTNLTTTIQNAWVTP